MQITDKDSLNQALSDLSPMANMAVKKDRLLKQYIKDPCRCDLAEKTVDSYRRMRLVDADFEQPHLTGKQLRNAWFVIPCDNCRNDILYVIGVITTTQKRDLIKEVSDGVKEHISLAARIPEYDEQILRILDELEVFYHRQQIFGLVGADAEDVGEIELHFNQHANYVGDPRYISSKVMSLAYGVFRQKALPETILDELFPVTDANDAVKVMLEYNKENGDIFNLTYRDRHGRILARFPDA